MIVESVYGSSAAHIFMIAAPLGVLTLLPVLFLPNLEVGNMTRHETMLAEEKLATAAVDGEAALETAEETVDDAPHGSLRMRRLMPARTPTFRPESAGAGIMTPATQDADEVTIVSSIVEVERQFAAHAGRRTADLQGAP